MFITLDDLVEVAVTSDNEFLLLDAALDALALMSPRQTKLVELRFFGGLSNAEIESVLGVGERTIERDWSAARAWLKAEIRKAH